MSQYRRLSGSMPAFPPAYDDSEAGSELPRTSAPVEQFEIDEDEVFEPMKRDGLLHRAVFATKRCVFTFRDRVVGPLSQIMDPLYEGYNYFHSKYELSVMRIGNPLVVKRLLYVLVVVAGMYLLTQNENNDGISGSSSDAFSSGKFYDLEKLATTLKAYIEPRSLEENIEYLSSMPHVAGTTGDLALAKYVESYFSNNGLQVPELQELESFLNYPKAEGTYLKLADDSFAATLYEGNSNEQMHMLAFNPNSPNSQGEIEAPFVYANHGDPQDLQKLTDAGIMVENAVLVVKYGGDTPEPNKVLAAARLKAKAVVFITPQFDIGGKPQDDVIEKINVGLTRVSTGDVLTPGYSAQRNAVGKLSWENSLTTAKIPTLPISWKDGKALVAVLNGTGHDFGDGWYSGKLEKKLKLSVQNEERSTHLLWNVYGYIPGREQTDKGVIFGAPRDSACFGASTAASGTAALLELVKIFTSLQRRYDWSPSRSIYFISFDATEYNLAGSAEWVKLRQKELMKGSYAYIDLNDLVSGDVLSVKANPLMHDLVKEELLKVELLESQKGKNMKTLFDLYKSQNGGNDRISNNMLENKNYLPFINMLNMPSMEIGFRGETFPKHSCANSFKNFEKQTASSMNLHAQVVELLGRIGLNLAENPIIPFDFSVLADRLMDYSLDLEKYAKAQSDAKLNHLEYTKLREAIHLLKGYANRVNEFRHDRNEFVAGTSSLEPAVLSAARRNLNVKMSEISSAFLIPTQGASRAGYLNLLFGLPFNAPEHDDDSFEWNTFPFVRDGIAENDHKKAQFEMERVAQLLEIASQYFND